MKPPESWSDWCWTQIDKGVLTLPEVIERLRLERAYRLAGVR